MIRARVIESDRRCVSAGQRSSSIRQSNMYERWFELPYRTAFPIAHLMRRAFPQQWLRIHALPESKRYAESDEERAIIHERYARFGTALLGQRAPCLIIRSLYVIRTSDDDVCSGEDFLRDDVWLSGAPWSPIHRVFGPEGDAWDSWTAPATWDPDAFRALLRAIADDEVAHVAFVSQSTGAAFAPYDGGADGFSFDAVLLDRLAETFAAWRSNHPLGV